MHRIGSGVWGPAALSVVLGIACLAVPAVASAQSAPPGGAAPPETTFASSPPPTTSAAAYQDAGMFAKGMRRISLVGGWGHTLGQDYLLLGIGAGLFVANGLDVGLDFEAWVLNDPQLYKISPRVDYVMWKAARLKPYVGGFYRWSFITGGLDDLSSLGGRAGLFYKGGAGGMAGAGFVYERYLDCDERTYSSCDVFYPEIFFAISF